MRITRRLLERPVLSTFVVVSFAAAGSVTASCGSGDGAPADVGPADVTTTPDAPDALDTLDAGADVLDAAPRRDAAKFDGGPLPVVCAQTPCATSLTTTDGYEEGFCALLQDGTVACWGQNYNYQLGRGADAGTADSPTPARVAGVSNIALLNQTCAVDKGGAVWCWGSGAFLRDPTQNTTIEGDPVKLPIPPATAVGFSPAYQYGAFDGTACAALVDGGVLCWGSNQFGQVAVPDLDASDPFSPHAIPIPSGAPINQISVGEATFILREGGTLWSWGATPPLGRLSSLFPDPYPAPIALTGVTSLHAISDNACATAEGIAYCWGHSPTPGLPTIRALPEPVETPEPVVQIATTWGGGNGLQPQRQCAVGASGAVYCWGNNDHGEAGDGTRTYALKPGKVVGLPGPAVQVKTTSWATCALLRSGKVSCWGDDRYGQLGTGKMKMPSLAPQEVKLP